MHRALITHEEMPLQVDTPLTPIVMMAQGAYCYFISL